MLKRISRAGIYGVLDKVSGSVEGWLDAKYVLDCEFLAEEPMCVVVDSAERDDEDMEEWLEREYA
jgi:hypothetical protein